MELSVIIVNYNVKHFLEQCLHSVLKASKNISAEIFVVDNNSVDGSTQLILEKFPGINFIENKENVGFSKANNQAARIAQGKYILLLNPDTVVEENTFSKVISFMEKHPDAGGLGVKMIDGTGNFLPESKRGLPTPWVAFYKMSGISRLFPKSKKFGKYHLSYLNENKIHEVDVLAGAFMLLRKSALDKVGLLDETFFMYGEDIDLSYRVIKGGYKNFYFPKTTIIHYKGESTKKGSLNYVRMFYTAMIIFARKHFSGGKANTFSFFIYLAIYFRAMISIVKRIFEKIYLPLFDGLLIFMGYLFLTPYWENLRFDLGYYPPGFLRMVVPVYIVFWFFGILFSGAYKKPVSLLRVARGVLWGSVSILLVYSLVDEKFRFSRALILLGSAWAVFILILFRLVAHWLKIKGFRLDIRKNKKIAIVGHSLEATRVKQLLQNTQIQSELAGFIAIDKSDYGQHYIGQLDQLKEIIRINRIDEIIFCAENISSAKIIRAMLDLTQLEVDYKIAPPESLSIIGSNSIHTAGELYVVNINAISKASNKRKKRIFDFGFSLVYLFLCPLIIWFFKNKTSFVKNIFSVLWGKKSWIGYLLESGTFEELPVIKTGILNPRDLFPDLNLDAEKKKQLNILYAKDYSLLTDTEILFKGWNNLDR
ncbi:MAG: glycosyltransferase [Prolixibacteraceae bacterium]|jgi:O-antigen biosynthesis protein|nr:glycosyltransferase [Prolixibacteraceae bacterium]MBT6763108.1 glycosyltransferase [Prolixibacteraceae bacterium]MBT6997195.1 glycosyltransferase [Prolixibacteraceae bacterium]MBT7393742.1 glycosyltransferase [Prolixibacteraceae bacterium]